VASEVTRPEADHVLVGVVGAVGAVGAVGFDCVPGVPLPHAERPRISVPAAMIADFLVIYG
jgi:hypothetical protein